MMFPGVFQAEKENWGGNGRLTLRMVARKVALLSCVIRTLMSIAERALGFRYWADQGQRYSTPTEQHLGEANSLDTDLTFDCSSFRSQYEFRLPARALCAASCPPAWRSEPDLRFLRSTLRTLPSFRRYSPHMQLKLAKVIRYERFGRGRVVVKRGQRGSSFYFVFSGIIAVTQDLDGSSAFTDQEPILMRKGAGFGEVALLKGLRRNATVVCVEDTELLVVDKEDFFSHQLDQELQKEALERYSFFRSLALFSSWSDAALETLADHCKTEQVHHDQVVLRDSSSTTSLIFITKGQCDVLRMVELSQCSSYHRWIRQQQALLDKTQGRTLTESGEIEKKVSLRPQDSPASLPASASHFQALFPEVDVLLESQVLGDWAIREQAFSLSDSGESENPDKNTPPGQESSLRKEIVPSKEGAGTPGGLPREVEAGVYMRIDTLKHGQHFTAVDMGYIQSCLEREGKLPQERPLWATPAHCRDPRGMVIVSQGAEVIRVKLEKFSELTDWATLEKLMRADQPYPRYTSTE
ncbi:cyclic nucleotide-binding domain-containing protein 2-like [Lepisosteus oculatus]